MQHPEKRRGGEGRKGRTNGKEIRQRRRRGRRRKQTQPRENERLGVSPGDWEQQSLLKVTVEHLLQGRFQLSKSGLPPFLFGLAPCANFGSEIPRDS